jgi:hypothetical protein
MRYLLSIVISFTFSSGVFAQSLLSNTSLFESGDKLSYSFKAGYSGKTSSVEYIFTEVTETELIGYHRRDDKIIPIKTPQYGIASYDMCWSVGQKCVFDPAVKLFDKNIKLSDQWVNKFKVTGEDFVSNVSQEVKVTKQEKVTLKFGEFDAYKIETKGKFNGSTSTNQNFSGTESSELWVASINNKMTLIKINYNNSFRDKFSAELDSLPTKTN